MLTKTDLKAIESLFDRKFDGKFKSAFEIAFNPIKKDLRKIKSDLKVAISVFDRITINHEERIKILESLRPALA
ncbi:hypothetical protein COY13_01820 [Candidatus Roizmanbacteria bacterium CG_4_10_14_0_2_um_filter_36_35]|uniref:Uncharacterized protein n=5 Tax=Candidatus Roizmaniibacteriota TaxID=1752723 RepID=A0A2M7BW85_9BACT|nr:MAG: hypothetical protein COV86_04510 [Candidatus Roizmanbacteria bacterium CG11_big_fil_rev_8_21_14_0_20_35_14]PIV10785.1 MAG: hypothetical protein COS50_03665 [Candidatus Roizmanbacteria bacterium CG03_land_8_20_14_0_80_35_26]PIZ68146.1 MAG: hypothetical protein COY13_01820 [Candidatus Roizmanbacteria bacterium CG_4_10_14_0_2_um_filter_36_35]PJC32316.1 MAG: hypothetical protein CO049_03225 [Candidatus Roizmanbacteria bacterium CG_4_9_14_0_2_um_filter_36_12]PJC81665.1 MAG: hypothetical prot